MLLKLPTKKKEKDIVIFSIYVNYCRQQQHFGWQQQQKHQQKLFYKMNKIYKIVVLKFKKKIKIIK